ncbi:MAG: hypothetical protein LBS21_10250 [Clostridiales bacterium]|jgi:Trp operon repressor|nr:hypothetical protein [Clostridiales bacterium]
MTALLGKFLTKEEREAAELKGRAEGELKILFEFGVDEREIAQRVGISLREVKRLGTEYGFNLN